METTSMPSDTATPCSILARFMRRAKARSSSKSSLTAACPPSAWYAERSNNMNWPLAKGRRPVAALARFIGKSLRSMRLVTGCTTISNQCLCVGELNSESMDNARDRNSCTEARRSLGSKWVSASVKRISSPRALSAPTRAALHLPAQSAGHDEFSTMRRRESAAAIGSSAARVPSVQRSSTKISSSAG